MKAALQRLKNRSNTAWAMGWTLVLGLSSSGFAATATDPTETLKTAICNIYTRYLSNTGLIFAVVVVIVAWAGYMIYMGKREATDVVVKAVIATAIVLGATTLAQAVVGTGSCQ